MHDRPLISESLSSSHRLPLEASAAASVNVDDEHVDDERLQGEDAGEKDAVADAPVRNKGKENKRKAAL